MGKPPIDFHFEQIDSLDLDRVTIRAWLTSVAIREQRDIQNLQYIICNDQVLLSLNQQFLDHDYYTDILTFPESYDPISAEVYVSLDRVRENAVLHGAPDVTQELYRVMLHGLLHMCGWKDESDHDRHLMRQREDHYLKELL